MKKAQNKHLVFLLVFFQVSFVLNFSSGSSVDSLLSALGHADSDSTKVEILLELARVTRNDSSSKSLDFSSRALQLSENSKFVFGQARSLKEIGIYYYNKGEYILTADYWNRSLRLLKSVDDRKGVSNLLSNLGVMYFDQGDDATALDFYLQSLRIAEQIKDTSRIVTLRSNIGAVYQNKKSTQSKAKEYFLSAIPLALLNEDDGNIGTLYLNLGEIYEKESSLDSALYYYSLSLPYNKGTEDFNSSLVSIGRIYLQKNDFNNAFKYTEDAYENAVYLGSKKDIAVDLVALGKVCFRSGDTKLALKRFLDAESILKQLGLKYQLKDAYESISACYASLGDYPKAFRYQNELVRINEDLFNLDIEKKLGTLQFSFDIEKKQNQINLLTKDQELKQQEIRRQKLVRNGFIGGFAVMLLFAGVFLSQRNRISKEKKRSDELLLNILPEETAEELKATGTAQAKSFDSVTVMFTDFKNFTKVAEKLTPAELVEYINHCFSEFDRIVMRYDIEKIKTIGDAYMCAGGLPVANSTHPQDVIMAGLEMQEFMRRHKLEREAHGLPYMELRLGIHTGPVVAGIVGIKKFAYDVWGDTVNTASRMESSGEPGKVNISGTTYDLVSDRFSFTYRGKIPAKNKGDIEMYFVEGLV